MNLSEEHQANTDETALRRCVMAAVVEAVRENRVIRLPEFDRARPSNSAFALAAIGESPSAFSGTVGPYRYQFEGEEDLLHLFVIRKDGERISVEEAQRVTGFLYENVPKALIWLKPGEFSQHFYIAHDHLLEYIKDN